MAGITRDWAAQNTNEIVRRNGGNSPPPPSRNRQSPATKLNPCHSGSGTKCRNHGKRFFGLGNRKAVGRSWSGLKLRYVWGHAGHWAVIILILPRMSSLKLRPRPRWVLRNLRAVTKASNNPDTRMQSLSLANGNFEEQIIENSCG